MWLYKVDKVYKSKMVICIIPMHTYSMGRLYRELTTEVILSTVLGQQVKVQQGEGTELYRHIQAVLNLLTKSRGHVPFIIQIGGM